MNGVMRNIGHSYDGRHRLSSPLIPCDLGEGYNYDSCHRFSFLTRNSKSMATAGYRPRGHRKPVNLACLLPQTPKDDNPCAKLKAAGVTKGDWSRMVGAYNSMVQNNSNPNNFMREFGFSRQVGDYYNWEPNYAGYLRNDAGRGFWPGLNGSVMPDGGAGINFHTHFNPGSVPGHPFGGINSVSKEDAGMTKLYGNSNMMFLTGSATSLYQFDGARNSWPIAGAGWWNLDCF